MLVNCHSLSEKERRRASEIPRSPRKKRRHSRSPNNQGVVQDVQAGLDSRFELLGIDGDQDVALINFERAKEVLGDSCEYPRLHRSACYFPQSAAQLWVYTDSSSFETSAGETPADFIEKECCQFFCQPRLDDICQLDRSMLNLSLDELANEPALSSHESHSVVSASHRKPECLRKSSCAPWHTFSAFTLKFTSSARYTVSEFSRLLAIFSFTETHRRILPSYIHWYSIGRLTERKGREKDTILAAHPRGSGSA